MKAPGVDRAAVSARRRLTEVVDAAARVFARRGYHGASTQDIADILGIRQASLYYYFDSKEAALEAVIGTAVEDYAARAADIARQSIPAAQKVELLIRAHLAPMVERVEYSRVFLGERRFLSQPARKRMRGMELRYERTIQKVIEQGIRSQEFRPDLDARLASLALLGLGNSAAAWFGREPGVTFERIARCYAELLIRGFRITH
jgi:AcrR family transcriptional regulator